MRHTLYILYSPSKDTYYVAFTLEDLETRVRKHNEQHKGKTGKHGDWELKYSQRFETRNHAIEREQQIKNWNSNKRIEALIKDYVPEEKEKEVSEEE